ncbi:AarF/UbiB family protein [Streptomyces sp. NPDC017988]|uniref:AarF/UbiB family protein n=1 Tax=Streptomyces sp. NPDC017988 TaxID=3365025 RepID=UPI0037B02261
MDFEYISNGILVEGTRYPILKMEWVEGVHLSQWLSANYQDQAAVGEVACKFAELINDLRRNNIAHGDLQHGNLLVAQDRTLRLVDYDGLFVPSLAGQRGNEIGHRNYQSPHRTLDDFGPDVDNFSSWVIYVSLIAVAADPALWSQFHEVDGEHLVLSEDDFSDPASSARFPDLLRHPNPIVCTSMSRLSLLCEERFDEIPQLDLNLISTGAKVDLHNPISGASAHIADSQPGRPSWLDIHTVTNATRQDYFVAPFQGRRLLELLLALLGFLTVTMPVIAGVANYLDFDAIVIGVLAMSSMFFALSAAARSRRAEIVALRNSQRSLDQLLALVKDSSASYATARDERAQLTADEESRIEENVDHNRELTRQLHRTYAQIESARSSAVEEIDRELRVLRAEQNDVISGRLRPMQQPWVDKRLPSFLLADAHLSGITSKHISALEAFDLRSAADIIGVKRIKGGTDALLITFDGKSVKVAGIGPMKADCLYAWRQRCEEELRASCPATLSMEEEAEVQRAFKPRFEFLADRKVIVDQEMDQKRSEARQEIADSRTRLADLHREELESLRVQTVDLDLRIADIRASVAEVHHLNQSRNFLVMGARKISYWKYLRFLYLQ